MRILFIQHQPLWIHGLPNGFADLGHEIFISGPLVTEPTLPFILEAVKPDLIFSMGWSQDHMCEGREWMKKYIKLSGIPFVFWATEDPAYTDCFTLPFIQEVRPDFVFTINRECVNLYNIHGFKAAHLNFGFHESVHFGINSVGNYSCPIAVVANAYPLVYEANPDSFRLTSIRTLITPLLKAGYPIHFWGKDWTVVKSYVDYDIPEQWIHGSLDYTEANKVYSSADIVIGLQNRTCQVTQRTFETLGSEGFLLTADTESVRQLFCPGRDLVTSSTPEETLKLVKFYLDNTKARESVRKQGRLAVNEHSYKNRAAYIINTLKTLNVLDTDMK